MDAAIVSRLCDSPGPQRVEISIGLRQLAFTTICGALEDAQGRTVGVYGQRNKTRRQNAANALRWLRGFRKPNLEPFGIGWVGHLLDVSPARLATYGVARVSGGGLENWRQWRAQRNDNRIRRLPRIEKRCAYCRRTFETKHDWRQYCSSACSNASRRLQLAQREGTAVSVGVDRYALYCLFCDQVAVTPATECWWRMVAG